ncbi:MAG TPA: hypothetical protein DCL44_03005 [Elusimicrobia bacterium]|nr:hypothetical protein [Elusimicrobiota bacterium]
MNSNEQNKKAEAAFFDNYGLNAEYDVLSEQAYSRIIGEFVKHIDLSVPNQKVIDLGCGTGAFISRFSQLPFIRYGMDISPNCIHFARNTYKDVVFDIGDIEKTKYPDETFDAVFLSGVLHHFPDLKNVVKESFRILKKGGVLLAYDPHKKNPFMWLYRCKASPLYSSKGVTINEEPLGKEDVVSTLEKFSFSQYAVYSISGITYKALKSGYAMWLLPLYNLIERILGFKPIGKIFGSFIITYAKK